MTTTRREFLSSSTGVLATGALASLGLGTLASSCASTGGEPPVERKRILILGGTKFVGPALVTAARERGHEVTLFNSGSTEAARRRAGVDSVIPEDVEVLIGNRDPLLTADDRRRSTDPDFVPDPDSPLGLSSLANREWDAVIDTSGFFPRMVEASASFLAPNVGQYVFISTISVYARNDIPGQDESGELATLEDPTVEEFGDRFQNYGGGKALCEAAAEEAMPGRTTNIRPGYIVGPRDTTRRYAYWPWRVSQGGEMIVPGTDEDPIQLIDVRDLAEWAIHCIENRTTGVFNATGPARELSMGKLLSECARGTGGDPDLVYVDPEFLAKANLAFPIWAPPTGETAGFHRTNVEKAVAAGLKFRPHSVTAADTLEWIQSLPEEMQDRVVPVGIAGREEAALQAWKQRNA